MKTLNVIYIYRIVFGILAAILATFLVDLKFGNPLINGISIALAFFLVTYYVLKWRYLEKVETPRKVFTMGIGAYFLTFILCWVLLITPFLAAPTVTFTVDIQDPAVGELITFNAIAEDSDGEIVQWNWNFGDGDSSEEMNPSHSYDSAAEYVVRLTVVDDHGISGSTSITLTVTSS